MDQRWVSIDRAMKARAILGTVRLHTGALRVNGTWLGVSCGSGEMDATLSCHVDRVIGIDPEPWLRWEDLRRKRSNLDCFACGYREPAESLGTANINVAVCDAVYEHVGESRALANQIVLVVKPFGLCCFAARYRLWQVKPHLFWPLVNRLPLRLAPRFRTMFGSRRTAGVDVCFWYYRRLVRLIWAQGYEHCIALLNGVLADAVPALSNIAFRIVTRVLRGVADLLAPVEPNFVFVLQKSE